MKKVTLLQILAGFAMIFFMASCNPEPVDVSDEISKANATFMESFNSGDMAGVAANYTENAKLFPANAEIIEGRANIEAFWGGAGAMGVRKVKIETTSAGGIGYHALEEGKYTLYTDGDLIIDEGKYMVAWEKIDGKWLLDRDIWNSNYPLPTGPNLEHGNVFGLHAYDLKLKGNVSPDQFEKFFNEEYIPAVEEAWPGVNVRLLKGERGEYKDRYGAIIYFKSLEERNYWIPEPGMRSEAANQAMEKVQPVWDRLNEMASFQSKYTDWIIL